MPLNINEEQDTQTVEVSSPEPILYAPRERRPIFSKIFLVIFLVAVIGSAVFLVYSLSVRSGKTPMAQQREAGKIQSGELTGAVSTPTNPSPTIESKEIIGGRYTIFISSYPIRDPAQEEVGRWNDAGYEAFVIYANDHYRVALGAYSGVSKARHSAEQLQEAFENGYWIGNLR